MCTTIQSTEEDRRANFVDKLLEEDSFSLTTSSSSFENSLPLVDSYVKDKDDLGVVKSNNRAKSMFGLFSYLNNITLNFSAKKFISRLYDPLILCFLCYRRLLYRG